MTRNDSPTPAHCENTDPEQYEALHAELGLRSSDYQALQAVNALLRAKLEEACSLINQCNHKWTLECRVCRNGPSEEVMTHSDDCRLAAFLGKARE